MNTEFSAIASLPIWVQVHDHGVLPLLIATKLIQVFFVETTGFIQRIVKFIIRDSGVAAFVQITDKQVHPVEKFIFKGIVMTFVKPMDFITSYVLVLHKERPIANTGRKQLLFKIKGLEVVFQMRSQCFI